MNIADTNEMDFEYDGAGNRVAKYTKQITDTALLYRNDYYMHDAQGNILAIYHENREIKSGVLQNKSLAVSEHDLYGSARLGVRDYWGTQLGLS